MMTLAKVVSVVIPVFQDAERILSAAHSLLGQVLPDGVTMEIVVVDDGSNGGTADVVGGFVDERVRLIQLAQNQGRSAARNTGAQQANGDVVAFMDCDCVAVDNGFLAAHLEVLRQGNVASLGHVIGIGDGFWDRYQRDASSRRERQHKRGYIYCGSSTNLAVVKSAFEQVGGFDVEYRRYGFEDRDLLLRLSDLGRVAWTNDAVVRHLDALTLRGVSCKMAAAGEFTSGRFASRHPAAYKVLGYAAIDSRKRRWLRPVGRRLGPHILEAAQCIEPALDKPWMPYPLAKGIVKLLSAISFLYGTTRARDWQ